MSMAPGSRFGSYEIAALIGVGGMGEVYRAHDPSLKRDVALKVLPQELLTDTNRLARLQREAEMLAALNHANVAHIYGLERSDGRTALVMELIDGVTLAERIGQGALPPNEALDVAAQIASALEAAHERGIVHRDLKPANIKLKADGTVKVLDFGIAKALDLRATSGPQPPALTTPAMTEAGLVLGTAAYMAPEQARGKPVDKRADIWAFGCVLYEMLTGKPAFVGDDVTTTLARVLERDPDLTPLPAALTPAVRRTLELCLQKDPKKRLHDIGDVRLALAGTFDTGAHGPASAAAGIRTPWQRPLPVAAAALLLGGLVGGVAVWKPPPSVDAVVTRFAIDLPASQNFRNTGRDIVALSPDGRYLAYNTVSGLYLRAMDDTEARLLAGTEGVLTNPVFSPDGEWIAYWEAGPGQLRKIRLTGGAPVTLAEIANPQGASWGQDGFIVFGQAEGIFRVSANGGAPEMIIADAGETEFLWDPQVLPGGSILYTAWIGNSGTIQVQTPGGDDRTTLFAGERAVYLPPGYLVVAEGTAAGGLFVRPFDAATRAYGGPVPIQEGAWLAQGKTHFAVSASGTLAFARGLAVGAVETVLALVDRDGNVERLNVEPNQYRGPRVSPDGTEIAVEIIGENERSSVWIYDLSGRRPFRPLLGAGSNVRPLWTPDGERLTYASDRDGTWGIYWQAADGGGVAERLTKAEANVEHWPDSWSADTRTLAFTRIEGSLSSIGAQDIWTVALDENGRAAEPQAFVSGGGAAFAPNGKWIAYRSGDATLGPVNQIHVQPFPPTGAAHAVTDQGGSYPTWSPDGGQLLYRRPAAGGNTQLTLGSVEVTTGDSFAWGNETTLPIPGGIAFFGYRDFDLLPGGQRLVTAVATDAAAVAGPQTGFSIEIVANWSELVKQRAPVP